MIIAPFLWIVWAFVLWVFYLAYVAVWVAHTNGKLATAPALLQYLAYFTLGIGLILDITFNVTVGTAAFLELPRWNFTFTARCAKWRQNKGYRGRLARWVCDGWLNPFQEHHC